MIISTLIPVPDHLETERLYLRVPKLGDGAIVNEAIRESFVKLHEWMAWAQAIPTIAESETFAREAAARFRSREEIPLLVFRKSDGILIGSSGLHAIEWSIPRFEIGYWLRTSMEGHGYMTEAVRGITQFAFERLEAVRVEIRCDARNRASAAVAERAGYTLEATLRRHARDMHGGLRDTLIYVKFGEG
jgi:RimJ/RimL family protein N-acetyltransferase